VTHRFPDEAKHLYAELETRHFTFRRGAVTKCNSIDDAAKRQIETRCVAACAGTVSRPASRPGKLLKYVGAGDYNIHLLEPGVLYQDCGR
jgi:hypothetical protein